MVDGGAGFALIKTRLAEKRDALAIVGLGYVGLPLALALSRHFRVLGFDKNEKRIKELCSGEDITGESDPRREAGDIEYTADARRLKETTLIIIAVPTPVDDQKNPDLNPLRSAMKMVGQHMGPQTVLVVESTVYPGATEEVAQEVLSKALGLKRGTDFKLGYSPERINPGDKEHTLDKITKIISGEDATTLELLESVYGTVTKIYRASSIATAEAAKVIENIQRDLNIALMNELALIFDRMGIDTNEVINAAASKWNFIPFRPGLVGGHCIGVDPYYLTHKAESLGYQPKVILSGRNINDSMGNCIAEKTLLLLARNGHDGSGLKVAVFGVTFKEGIKDIRNSKVVDIIRALQGRGVQVFAADPWAMPEEFEQEYGISLVEEKSIPPVHAVILAVAHPEYRGKSEEDFFAFTPKGKQPVFIDVKSVYPPGQFSRFTHWRL